VRGVLGRAWVCQGLVRHATCARPYATGARQRVQRLQGSALPRGVAVGSRASPRHGLACTRRVSCTEPCHVTRARLQRCPGSRRAGRCALGGRRPRRRGRAHGTRLRACVWARVRVRDAGAAARPRRRTCRRCRACASRTSRAATRPRRSWRRWWSSCARPPASRAWAAACPRASCSRARQAPARALPGPGAAPARRLSALWGHSGDTLVRQQSLRKRSSAVLSDGRPHCARGPFQSATGRAGCPPLSAQELLLLSSAWRMACGHSACWPRRGHGSWALTGQCLF